MIGDDVRDDILGAQNVGFTVSTIKYVWKEKFYLQLNTFWKQMQ